MNFARPEYLWLTAFLVPLAIWSARGRLRRARGWSALAQGGRLRGDGSTAGLGAIACLVVALAQPRWGLLTTPPLPPGRDVVLLVDTSRSMATEDAVPNRLSVAVEAAESLLTALGRESDDRAGVVAFAGRGRERCPLTDNLGAVAETLRSLRPGDVHPGGTDLGEALDAALEAFDDQEHAEGRAIVVFSDGEDLVGNWSRAVEPLRAAGVVVHAVAVGDAEQGHPVPSGEGGRELTYRGAPVLSKRSDLPLQALTNATGGAVVKLGLAPADLGALYRTRIEPVARRRREASRRLERAERYAVFVVAALVVGLGGSWPGRLPLWRTQARALGVIGLVVFSGATPGRESSSTLVAEGRSAYEAGKYGEALDAFQRAAAAVPDDPISRYDGAAALFQLGRFEEALARYQEARRRAAPGLRTKIDYALGNTALALGDVEGAIGHYQACLASTVPGHDAVRRDAAINLKFAEEQTRKKAPAEKPDSPRQNPRPKRSADGPPQGEPPPSSNQSPPGGAPPDGPSSGKRGAGGAGGSGDPPPRSGSPEDRLNAALENIRDAKRRRLPDEPPPVADVDRKDW